MFGNHVRRLVSSEEQQQTVIVSYQDHPRVDGLLSHGSSANFLLDKKSFFGNDYKILVAGL